MAANEIIFQQVLDLIPQQPPFRFIDEILAIDERRISAAYRFKENEYFYAGHFPGNPVTPGVILIEAMAQTGVVAMGIYQLLRRGVGPEKLRQMTTLFALADSIEFFAPVVPGERVITHGELVYLRQGSLKAKTRITRESGEIVCAGVLTGAGVTGQQRVNIPELLINKHQESQLMKRRVVVTGMGVVSPNGIGLKNFEIALRSGKSGIRFMPELERLKFACQIGGVPENFEKFWINAMGGNPVDSPGDNIAYASLAALSAWKDAGLPVAGDDDPADWDTGTIFGCGICGMETIANTVVPMVNAGNVRRLGSQTVERVMASGISAHVGGLLGLGNQVTSNSAACSTGTEAVIEAAQRIRAGLARRMVVGGAEGASPYTWAGFDAMRVLARKFNDQPGKGSRPMSADACGFVPGAGAGALVLEDLESAQSRGCRIYAEIAGGMVNCGGQRSGGSMTAPNPQGVVRCIQGALKNAGITADAIDAINGHLTATFADPYEVKNWAKALHRGPADFPVINSTKSMIGHCLGAAGAIETVAAILQIYKGFVHPSVNCEDIHPEIREFEAAIPRTCRDVPGLATLAKACFGFGDVNSCLIIQKWTPKA